MERRHNPYAPGAGLQPPELAGRDRLIEDVAIDMDRLLDRRPTKGMMLLGLRGVGKTVLLNRLHHMADEKGIHTAKIEAPEGGTLPQLLAPELRRQQLIDKGMVWSQRHGETAFTVPMFDAFMKRQIPVSERHKPKRRKLKRR